MSKFNLEKFKNYVENELERASAEHDRLYNGLGECERQNGLIYAYSNVLSYIQMATNVRKYTFPEALEMLINNDTPMRREGWGDRDYRVCVAPAIGVPAPYLYMAGGEGKNLIWNPGQNDIFAKDWAVWEGEE